MAYKLATSLRYLESQQSIDGGFLGQASSDQQTFSHPKTHYTVFFTALMATSLARIVEATTICTAASDFLLQHKSKQWSWNYWLRGSSDDQQRPYPDDLDDTACALAAITSYRPGLIDGSVLGHFAQQLITNEHQAGGPYQTWLIDRRSNPDWEDVDLAVNANISYFLSLQQVTVPGLESYLTAALETSQPLTSSYYLGQAPLLYFMARSYGGPASAALRQRILDQIAIADQATALNAALLLCAGQRAGLRRAALRPLQAILLQRLRSDGSWPPAALYVEPYVGQTLYYAGSAALTTSFALEALVSYADYQLPRTASGPPRIGQEPNEFSIVARALGQTKQLPDGTLRREYRAMINQLAALDSDHQVLGMADIIAEACARPLSLKLTQHLNLASLHGWIAYTIYDDFLDGEGRPRRLGVANVALRRSLAQFGAALPDDQAFQGLVETTFDEVDSANSWELAKTRRQLRNGRLIVGKLPDYGNHYQLAARSWGHMLAAVGVLHGQGYAPDSRAVLNLQRFFQHFLIARQLHDDAHDWEDDLQRGQLSAVVCLLLRTHAGRVLQLNPTTMQQLRQQFWETTIDEVHGLIMTQLAAAQQALDDCSAITNDYRLRQWLDHLATSSNKALRERDEAQKFIASYNKIN